MPFLDGLRRPSESSLKHLGAAMASSGMASIFYYKAPYPKSSDRLEVISVDADDVRRAYESLSTTNEKPDMVYIGCPHCSAEEIRDIAEKIRGRRVREDVKLWICTSRYVRERAAEHVRMIEAAGGKVLVDTCAVVTWIKELGVDVLMTNSAKTAFYAPTMNGVETIYASLDKCIDASCSN